MVIRISDLGGHPVRLLYDGHDGPGRYRRCWDGRDDAGRLVSPGVYLYRASVSVDRRDVTRTGVLSVSY